MTLAVVVLGFVTLQRLGELALARRNTACLKALGAVEAGAAHYPAVVMLHASWLAGLWLLAWEIPPNLAWLALFALLQVLRIWVLVTLGRRWTTRILVLPDAPLVRHGPYRFFAHPNYAVVTGEIAVLPLAFGLYWYALVFSLLNAIVLTIRIRAENAALRSETRTDAAGRRATLSPTGRG
jgi:methyltransferase